MNNVNWPFIWNVVGVMTLFVLGCMAINFFLYEDDLSFKQKCLDLGGRFTGDWYQVRYCSFPNRFGVYDSDNRFIMDYIRDFNGEVLE